MVNKNVSYHFRVGDFECLIVSDGTFNYPHPAQVFFPEAPEKQLNNMLGKYDLDPETWEYYESPYSGLVVKTDDHCVLIDTGAGDLAPTTGQLFENLTAEGFAPDDIDTVIITHAHPDHIGGITSNGKLQWPDARYVMWKEEWEYWTSNPDLSSLKVPPELIELIRKFAEIHLPAIEDRVDLIDREEDIVPGIRAVAAPGHTPGHMALHISSGGEHLFHICDTVIHPIHVEKPEWLSAVDILPDQTVRTRQRLLKEAAEQQYLVLAYHFPFPCLGHVNTTKDGWQWQRK